MNIYVMKAAMKARPYLLNAEPLPPGYWKEFFSRGAEDQPWNPPRTTLERKSSALSDMIGWIGGVPLFSDDAVDVLNDAGEHCLGFKEFGELKGRRYRVICSMPTVAVLNQQAIAQAPPIFAVDGNEFREVLVKEVVPALVVRSGLKGFEFRSPHVSHLRELFEGKDTNVYPGVLP